MQSGSKYSRVEIGLIANDDSPAATKRTAEALQAQKGLIKAGFEPSSSEASVLNP